MSTKKIIAVTGATGAQGGGLVRSILNDKTGEFTVRAITRKTDSDKAKALIAQGVEVVTADLDDTASLTKAFAGAYGVFCVTNFWEHFSAEKEVQQVKNMATAAKSAGVQHVIWSTLEDTRKWIPLSDTRMPTLQGHYKVPHFDGKGESDKIFAEMGVPTTNLVTSAYWENFIYFGWGPTKNAEGKFSIVMPMGDKKLPAISVEDIGKCALGIFKKGNEYIGKTVGIAGEHLTGAEMAAKMSKAVGREILYTDVPPEVYRTFGFPEADDVGNMFQFKRDFNEDYVSARSLAVTKSLNPELQDFDSWLAKNAKSIPLES